MILDNKYVFRFPKDRGYAKLLKTEIPLMEYLSGKLSLEIPRYKFVAHDKSFAGYEMIQGMQLKTGIFDRLSQQTRQRLAKQLAKFLRELHAVPMKQARRFGAREPKPEQELAQIIAKTKKYIYPRVSGRTKQLIEKFLSDLRVYCLKFSQSVLIHNDLYPAHILFSANRIVGIIDFADRSMDDPALDFAEFWVYGEKFVRQIYKYYAKLVDEDFLIRSKLYYKRSELRLLIATRQQRKGNFRQELARLQKIFSA